MLGPLCAGKKPRKAAQSCKDLPAVLAPHDVCVVLWVASFPIAEHTAAGGRGGLKHRVTSQSTVAADALNELGIVAVTGTDSVSAIHVAVLVSLLSLHRRKSRPLPHAAIRDGGNGGT